jgi:pimeloyl-ACP methyl ester carboxylesterase
MRLDSSQSIQSQVRSIHGLSIRYAESELREDHALLLSPWPESIYCYEPTWSRLAEHTHLVAIDPSGFGRSERRDSLMSLRTVGEFLVRAADARSALSSRMSWGPISELERRSLPQHCILAGFGASSSARAALRSRCNSRQ